MNAYIQVIDGVPGRWAYAGVAAEWSHGFRMSAACMSAPMRDMLNLQPYRLRTPPAYDPTTQTLTEGPPELVEGTWTQTWTVADRPQDEAQGLLVNGIAELAARIDADADAFIFAVIGNRQSEYERAEREAHEYKDAGYPDDPVPPSVRVWAIAKQWSAQQACDDILMQAAMWREAQVALRGARLLYKQQAANATNGNELAEARAGWESTVRALIASLAI